MAVEADPQRKGVENRDDEDTIIRKILELASQYVLIKIYRFTFQACRR